MKCLACNRRRSREINLRRDLTLCTRSHDRLRRTIAEKSRSVRRTKFSRKMETQRQFHEKVYCTALRNNITLSNAEGMGILNSKSKPSLYSKWMFSIITSSGIMAWMRFTYTTPYPPHSQNFLNGFTQIVCWSQARIEARPPAPWWVAASIIIFAILNITQNIFTLELKGLTVHQLAEVAL